MATYSLNPRKFTGVEKMIVDALVLKIDSLVAGPYLAIPFPDRKAAESAKAKTWAYVRAMEACADMKHMLKCGYSGPDLATEQRLLAVRAEATRKFTTRLEPQADGTVHLVWYLTMDRPQDQLAVEALANEIMTMIEGQKSE